MGGKKKIRKWLKELERLVEIEKKRLADFYIKYLFCFNKL